MGDAELWLRTVWMPNAGENIEDPPLPQFSEFENLSHDNASGWSVATFSPNTAPTNNKSYTLADFGETDASVQYLFVPPNWSVTIMDTEGSSIHFPGTGSVDLNQFNFTGGNIAYGNISTLSFVQIAPEGHEQDWSTTRRSICNGTPYYITGIPMPQLVPQGAGCDLFMETTCALDENKNDLDCSCIVEQAQLAELYPNSITEVTCLGKNCGLGGYKTERMAQEKCSISYCTEFLDETGKDIVESGTTNIYCSGHSWQLNPDGSYVTPSVPPTIPIQQDLRSTPAYIYVMLVVMLGVGGLLLYMVYKSTVK